MVIILIVATPSSSSAQDQAYIDSLISELDKPHHDTTMLGLRANIGELAMTFRISFWDSIIADGQALIDGGSLNEAEKKSICRTLAQCFNNSGFLQDMHGNVDDALIRYQESVELYDFLGRKSGKAIALNNIGYIHQNRSEIELALDYYTSALKIHEQLGENGLMANSMNNIGYVYGELGERETAIDYYEESVKLFYEAGDSTGAATPLNNIAQIYIHSAQYEKALEGLLYSLSHTDENNTRDRASSYNNIGLVYRHLGKYDTSMHYFNTALAWHEANGNLEGLQVSLRNLAFIYKEEGEIVKAHDFAEQSLEIAQKLGYPSKIQFAAKILSDFAYEEGDTENAYKFLQLHNQMKDSAESLDNKKAILRQQYKFEYDKKEALIEADNKRIQEVADANDKRNFWIIAATVSGALALAIIVVLVLRTLRVTRKQKAEVQLQKEIVEEKNQEITDSITYAKRIQGAILPPVGAFKNHFADRFVFYRPKDIVAGDFYWLQEKDDIVFFAVADCTGHGVPGALVSVVCHNALNRSIREFNRSAPGEILDKARELVVSEFISKDMLNDSEDTIKDGMDIALCAYKKTTNELQFAGANNPLTLLRKDAQEFEIIKGSKQPVGMVDNPTPFETHTIQLQKGDQIYLYSDGYVDQFGGEKGKKLKAKAFREMLNAITTQPMEQQGQHIAKFFDDWKGGLEQVDDVCVIGLRL